MLSPVLHAITRLLSSNTDSRGNPPSVAVVDRALGTVATIGLTVAVYRLISTVVTNLRGDGTTSTSNGDSPTTSSNSTDVPLSFYTLTQVLLRGVLKGGSGWNSSPEPLVEGMEVVRSEGGDVLVEATGGVGGEPNSKMRCYRGSCHCNSIRFRLRAPSHMFAKDCKGKIRYPHIATKADNFELLNGTEFLSVYYVQLPDNNNNNNHHTNTKGNIAAHTFCNRCGVHILRAPNPNSDELEVNTNCLNIFYDKVYTKNLNKTTRSIEINLDVTTDGNDDGRGLGSGQPLVDRLTTVIDDEAEENEEDASDTDDTDWPSHFRPQSYADNSNLHPYHHQYPQKQQPRQLPHNNSDKSPHKSSSSRTYVSSASESTMMADDSINTSSIDGMIPPPSTTSELSFDNGHGRDNTISPLNVGTSSFQALAVTTPSPRPLDVSPSPRKSGGGGEGGGSIALTQLKYYMKKHNATSSLVADE